MLQVMPFDVLVHFEKIININNNHFYIEIMISAAHMLGGLVYVNFF